MQNTMNFIKHYEDNGLTKDELALITDGGFGIKPENIEYVKRIWSGIKVVTNNDAFYIPLGAHETLKNVVILRINKTLG